MLIIPLYYIPHTYDAVDIKTLLFLCLCTVQSIEASVSVSDVGCDRMQSASTGDEVVADAILKVFLGNASRSLIYMYITAAISIYM